MEEKCAFLRGDTTAWFRVTLASRLAYWIWKEQRESVGIFVSRLLMVDRKVRRQDTGRGQMRRCG